VSFVPSNASARVELDGVDVTELVTEGSHTRRLNRVSDATVKINMEELAVNFGTLFPTVGSYLKIYMRTDASSPESLVFHGRVMEREVTADADTGYAVFNASDPMELWTWRPVRDDDGDFSLPTIIEDNLYATQIMHTALSNSETAGAGPPHDAEGPLRQFINSVAGGVTSVVGAPKDWPMTIAELCALLVSTGTLDVINTPIEFDADDNYGQLDMYNGDYGNDLHASVIFQYGFGLENIRSLRWNTDMSNMCNKLWYFLGPKCDDQHWRANVTGDAALAYPPGGKSVGPCDTGSVPNNQIGVLTCQSRQHYDVRMEIQIFDAAGDNTDCSESTNPGYELYKRNWQTEQWIRAQPRELVHVTPSRDVGILEFDIGDLITVEADSDVAGGFSGVQRVYEYTVSWDADESVPALSELQVSSDNEGFQ
jgi:hypothetical protein